MFHKLYNKVISEVCCLCDTYGLPGLDLCHSCHNSLPFNLNCCFKCAAPLADTARAEICGKCLSEPNAVDFAIVPFLYRPPMDYMIKRLKFSEENKYSRVLGDLLADEVERQYAERPSTDFPDIILPVPVHRKRLLERGFNQAEQIARSLTDRFRIPADTTTVARSAVRQPQSKLSAAQREANIRRAFDVRQPRKINGLHIAVVDDVYTTGATARAISKRLKSAGAAKVSVWAIARTP